MKKQKHERLRRLPQVTRLVRIWTYAVWLESPRAELWHSATSGNSILARAQPNWRQSHARVFTVYHRSLFRRCRIWKDKRVLNFPGSSLPWWHSAASHASSPGNLLLALQGIVPLACPGALSMCSAPPRRHPFTFETHVYVQHSACRQLRGFQQPVFSFSSPPRTPHILNQSTCPVLIALSNS